MKWDDPDVGIVWPAVDGEIRLSAKDGEHRGFKAVSYTHLDVYKRQAPDGINKRAALIKMQSVCAAWRTLQIKKLLNRSMGQAIQQLLLLQRCV